MTDRSDLVRAIQQAQDGRTLAQAVAALDAHDQQRTASLAADRELDLGARIASQRLTPVPLHEHHTAATDWLADYEPVTAPGGYRPVMVAEASTWYAGLDQAVKADGTELTEQARGRARSLASRYASHAADAEREFLAMIAYLHQFEGASGLPQIDQLIDPNNAPSQTPYPAEVFPTFGEEQDQFNGVETNNHQSGISSEQAPLLQQVNQQNASGSGFGTGPEKPDEHSTGFDTSNSYAEVPLGPPGQIPTTPAATDSMASSHPNPVAGTPQDAGADRRQAVAAVQGYSMPDAFGYRWITAPEIAHPFHERCASAHWPDEPCGDRSHTASVAIGYSMNLDAARRLAQCEHIGAREGLRAFYASHSLAELTERHNRVTSGWAGSDRSMEDTAVLHGFMAVVRPAMADLAAQASAACSSCKGGSCAGCTGNNCSCGQCGGLARQASLVTARDFSKKQREKAESKGDALPGGKLPVENEQDFENAEHLKGKVKGVPKSEVSSYMKEKAKEYGGKGKKDHAKAAALGREPNFT